MKVGAILTRKRLARTLSIGIALWIGGCAWGVVRPLPDGVSVEGPLHDVPDLEFIYDLTYRRGSATVVEQAIFDRIFQMIDEAERFIVLDMFLFNSEHAGDRDYLPLTERLTDHLVARRRSVPGVTITFMTDEINNFYGAYTATHLARLDAAGVAVVVTDLTKLRDSNPAYSAIWRGLIRWFGTAGPGWLPHPLTRRGRKVTARSYLKLLNMKSNHRKLIVTALRRTDWNQVKAAHFLGVSRYCLIRWLRKLNITY